MFFPGIYTFYYYLIPCAWEKKGDDENDGPLVGVLPLSVSSPVAFFSIHLSIESSRGGDNTNGGGSRSFLRQEVRKRERPQRRKKGRRKEALMCTATMKSFRLVFELMFGGGWRGECTRVRANLGLKTNTKKCASNYVCFRPFASLLI